MPNEFEDGLRAMAGKLVQVKVKRSKAVDQAPGEDPAGFFIVDYTGHILSPAIRPYPENNPNGVPCLFIQTIDGRKEIVAIQVSVILEVDDELPPTQLQQIDMAGLTNPTSSS